MKDWLGYTKLKPKFNWLPFEELKKEVQKKEIKNRKEWRVYWSSLKKSSKIPCAVSQVYKDNGWKGWDDFLGREPRSK